MTDVIKNFNFDSLKNRAKNAENSLSQIREFVNSDSKLPGEIANLIGQNIDEWIKIQVSYANLYHLNGYETNLISTSIFEKSKESMGRLRASLNVVLSFDSAITPQTLSKLSENVTGILTNIDSPGLSISENSKKQIEEILKSNDWLQVLQMYNKVIEKSTSGQYGIDSKYFSETITRVIDKLRDVISSEINQSNELIKDSESASSNKYYFSLTSILFLLIFSFSFSFIIVNSVNKTLLTVAGNITKGADSVSTISSQIAETSQRLSSSSTEQAAALQETTSAIEQTNAMIAKNAENAKRSAEVSIKSQATANEGKTAVSQMLNSISDISGSNNMIMEQIKKSNQEISEINHVIKAIEEKTKVINDIVFQTKFLSFNASVEAARAGEHGKGFSVVAEEISNLAEMSGRSSKEISQLLDDSTKKVDEIVKNMISNVTHLMESSQDKISNGQVTAERCSEILEEIVTDVSQVNSLVSDISVASQEQSRGVEEINKAMSELDTAAQQNNSSAQESASSATELNNQVQDLIQMVVDLNSVVLGKS